MSKHKNSNIITLSSRSTPARISLNDSTPPGLFETDEGNRYVIANHGDFSVAIILAHVELPVFTWFSLPRSCIAAGSHWAHWRLRLTTACAGHSDQETWARDGDVGDMMVSETGVALNCVGMDGAENWMGLSTVREAITDLRDYSGWALDVLATGETFFETGPSAGEAVRVLHSNAG